MSNITPKEYKAAAIATAVVVIGLFMLYLLITFPSVFFGVLLCVVVLAAIVAIWIKIFTEVHDHLL